MKDTWQVEIPVQKGILHQDLGQFFRRGRIDRPVRVEEVDKTTLEEWIREGRIGPSTRVRRGSLEWLEVRMVPELRDVKLDPMMANDWKKRQLREVIPALPSDAKCPVCSEEIKPEALRCRHCGAATVSPEWQSFVNQYNRKSEQQRGQIWSAMEPSEQEYLTRLIEQAPAVGDVSCPQCSGPAYGGRGCLVWGLVVFTFPIGLLFLLIRPRYTCARCGFTFTG